MGYLLTHYNWQVKQMKPRMEAEALVFVKKKGERLLKAFNGEM